MEQEWYLLFDDVSNIDAADTEGWTICYREVKV